MINEIQFNLQNISSEHLILVVVGYLIVFLSLVLLASVFQKLPLLLQVNFKSLFKQKETAQRVEKEGAQKTLTGEESAAISAAIFLFINELHDDENTVLTVQKITKKYSPWNSKIYNVTNGLNKRF